MSHQPRLPFRFPRAFLFPAVVGLLFLSAPHQATAQTDNDDASVPGWRVEFLRRYELPRDYGHDWRLGGVVSLTTENGLVLGAGPILYEFGFRVFPYVYRMELLGAVSIPDLRGKISYDLSMPAIGKKTSLELTAHLSQLEARRWYGVGNGTPRDIGLERDRAYEVRSREFSARAYLLRSLSDGFRAGVGLSLALSSLRPVSPDLVPGLFPPGFGASRTHGGFGLLARFDSRDDFSLPHSGVFAEAGGWAHAGLKMDTKGYQRIFGHLRVFFGDTLFTDVMTAFRAGGERVFGEFPVDAAATLGGGTSLRGFPFGRFAGDASVYAGAELRWSLGRWVILIPTEIGLAVGFDVGRVWFRGASHGGWHTSPVAGVWGAPLSREFLLFGSVARSNEGWEIRAGAGMDF